MTACARPANRRPLAEPMEARILHSADLPSLIGATPSFLQHTAPDEVPLQAGHATQGSEIVFIDTTLPDAQGLIADLQAQQRSGRAIEIVTIDAGQDGLSLIGSTLAQRDDISAVHVLAHGSDGRLQLGSSALDAQTLVQRAGELAGWSEALTADADLLLYGCNLAQGPAGQQLLQGLTALTGADVAASADLTGAAAHGGNWTLEYDTGHIEAVLAPSAREQAQWQGTMATYTVTSTLDVVGANLLPGTLRWAISQANAHAGTDTIVFAVDGTINLALLTSGDDRNAAGDFDITDSLNIVGNGSGKTIIAGNGLDRLFDVRAGTVSLSGLTVQGGVSNKGAGIQLGKNADLTLTDVVVQDNVGKGASKGGGIYADGVLTLRRTVVQNNGDSAHGNVSGAGIYVDNDGSIDARDVEIRGNTAAGNADGGGLYIANGESSVRLENVTIAGNRAESGGGLWNHGNQVSLVNATISGNSASKEGGGLWTDHAVSLDHVTIAYNSASSGKGGGVFDNHANVTMKNSLFASNTGGNTSAALRSLGYNLSDDNSAGFTGTGDLKNVAAGIGTLASNGGFTRTISIGAGSAARNAANPATLLTADQRGYAYYGGRADIGAYEYSPYGFAPTISPVADQAIDEDGSLGPIAFRIGDAETDVDDLIVTARTSDGTLVPNANIVIGGSGANRTISLTPAANASGGPITITITVSDGGNVVETTFQLTVRPVNDAPAVALPVSRSLNEDGILTLVGASAPSIRDIDAGGAPLQVTIAVGHGTLTLAQTTGLVFVTGNGSNDATMTFSGTQAAINAALDGLEYRPGADYNGSDRLDLSVNDLGNSGSGGARVDSGSMAIVVNAVNDAPAWSLPGGQVTPLLTALTFSPANGNAITLGDIDAGAAVMQIQLTTAGLGNGTLSFGSLAGLTIVSGTGSNDVTIILRGSADDLNAALETLSFNATAAGAARIDLLVDDLGNSGSGGARQDSGSVAVTVGNDAAPVITLGNTTRTFTEGDGSIRLDPGLTLADSDNATLASARVSISGGYAGPQDVLGFVNDGATMGNITASYSAGVLTLVSVGQTATLAEWEAALRAVTYSNATDDPSAAPRTLSLTVNDGIADSAARRIVLTVVPVNDAPVLSGANHLVPIVEDASSNGGTLVSSLVAGHVSDADANAVVGIAIISVDNSHGTWQYSTNGGSTWIDIGTVGDGAALLLAADANNAVRFVPDADWNGTVTGGMRWRAWDRTSGSDGGTADARTNGGSSAFSTTTVSSNITVSAVNDAPVVNRPVANRPVTEDQPFVFTLPAGSFRDVDAGDSLSFTATLANGAALPSWLHFDIATQTFSGMPGNAQVGSISVRVTAIDGSGKRVSDDFTLTVANVNDAPTVDQPIPDQSTAEDQTFTFAMPGGSFGDVDAGDGMHYAATLATGAALPSWLHFDAATQTFSGAPGNAQVGSLTLRVTATDSSGAQVSGDFALTVTNVNDAPVLAHPIIDHGTIEGSPVRFRLPAASFTDADAGDGLIYQATLADGSALPAWLHFDAANLVFVADPHVGDVGQWVVRITATDGSGESAQGLFAFVVAARPSQPQTPAAELPPSPSLPPTNTAEQEAPEASPAPTPSRSPSAPAPTLLSLPVLPTVDRAADLAPALESNAAITPTRAQFGLAVESASITRPTSRADSVLAAAVLPQYADLSLAPLTQLLHSDELMRRLDDLQRELSEPSDLRRHAMASSIAVTGGLTVGYVVWLVRGGVLVSSMLSALPAWQMIDPLPVLAASRAGARRDASAAQEEPEVERLFDEGQAEPVPELPRAAPAGARSPHGDIAPTETGR